MIVYLWEYTAKKKGSVRMFFNKPKQEALTVTSDAFTEGGKIPLKYTGRAEDISPGLKLSAVSEKAKSIAVVLDDLDVPGMGILTHWVIWNLPVQNIIPENIPHGESVPSLGDAMQGIGYGRHRYRGPNPPRGSHRYRFNVYVLDKRLGIAGDSGKNELMKAMEGHILQSGTITGQFE
jgi:Raf kinase inhibitor-like YbhB/YbcL family protein